jgi:hypothetical protein
MSAGQREQPYEIDRSEPRRGSKTIRRPDPAKRNTSSKTDLRVIFSDQIAHRVHFLQRHRQIANAAGTDEAE